MVRTYDASSRYTWRYTWRFVHGESLSSVLLVLRRKFVSRPRAERKRGVQVHARKYGRAVHHGVSALPHKSHDIGPSLISLFNLRVRNNYVWHLRTSELLLESTILIAIWRFLPDEFINQSDAFERVTTQNTYDYAEWSSAVTELGIPWKDIERIYMVIGNLTFGL